MGSSSSSRSGAARPARGPSITRRRQPPDKCDMRRIASELQARDDLIDLELGAPFLVRARRRSRPARSTSRTRTSLARRHFLRAGSPSASPGESTPRPQSGAISRLKSFSSEDLPAPLRPSRQTRSPFSICRSASSSSGLQAVTQRDFIESSNQHERYSDGRAAGAAVGRRIILTCFFCHLRRD